MVIMSVLFINSGYPVILTHTLLNGNTTNPSTFELDACILIKFALSFTFYLNLQPTKAKYCMALHGELPHPFYRTKMFAIFFYFQYISLNVF